MLSIIYKKFFKVQLVWSGSCGGLYRHWLANSLLEVDNELEGERCLHQPTKNISRSPPTSDRTSDYQEDIVVFKHVDKSAVEALTRLDIHYLHSDVSQNNPLLQLLVKNSFAVTPQTRSNIGFLANNFVVDKLIGLPTQDHFTIHQSLYETQLAIKSTLSSPEKEKFSRLPTFHVLQDNGKFFNFSSCVRRSLANSCEGWFWRSSAFLATNSHLRWRVNTWNSEAYRYGGVV